MSMSGSTAPMQPPPEMTVEDGRYTFRWPNVEYAVVLNQLRETRDDITAECTVLSQYGEMLGRLWYGRLNLLSVQTRNGLAKTLTERANHVDWHAGLTDIAMMTVDNWRHGEPTQFLDEVPVEATRWLLYPYLEYGGPTTLYAMGGLGKSMIALAIAYSVQTGDCVIGKLLGPCMPVMFCDWETSAATHAERLRAICTGRGKPVPRLAYRRMSASLASAADVIKGEVKRLGIGLIVIDSLGMAAEGDIKEAMTANATFQALRRIGVPALCIHHRAKGQPGVTGSDTSPFGSVYYTNNSRLVWEMDGISNEGDSTIAVSLTNRKVNNGPMLKRHALQLTFDNDTVHDRLLSIRIASVDLMSISHFAEKMPLIQRAIAYLMHSKPMEAPDLGAAMELDESQVKSLKARLSEEARKDNGRLIHFPGRGYAVRAMSSE